MPELPEVEVSRQGLLPYLVGQRIERTIFRVPRLRRALTEDLAATLVGQRIVAIARRGKYLLFDCEIPAAGRGEARDGDGMTDGGNQHGWLIVHLGMSGSLRLVPPGTAWQKHDHVDLVFADTVLRFRDPRRFKARALLPICRPRYNAAPNIGCRLRYSLSIFMHIPCLPPKGSSHFRRNLTAAGFTPRRVGAPRLLSRS